MVVSRFVVAGAVNTGATYVLYLLLLAWMPYAWAYSVSYVAGLVMGYLLNAYWVFKVKPAAKSVTLYPLAYVFNYLFGLVLLSVLIEYLGVPREIAPLTVVAASVPLMYLLMKYVFQGKLNEKTIHQ